MFIETPQNGYWFKAEGIRKIEEMKGATYMGYWATKSPNGNWNEQPVDVFYQPNPDTAAGHTHYFGMFRRDDNVYITEASTAFSDPITGVLTDSGEIIVSRYRHNYVEKQGKMIDGGRDYIRSNVAGPYVRITVNGSEFVFEEVEKEDS